MKFITYFENMFQTKHNRRTTRGERNFNPSRTVPDQTMSLKTLLTKYSRGMPINTPTLNMEYSGEQVARDMSKLDLADQEEQAQLVVDALKNEKRSKHSQQAKLKAEATKMAENNKLLEEKLKQLEEKLRTNNP